MFALKVGLRLHDRVARWRRAAPTSATHVVAICSLFGALILAGLYAAKDHIPFFRPAAIASGPPGGIAGPKAAGLVGGAELNPGDPVMRFSDTRVGHMLFATSRSDNCRRMLFDNRTGAYYESPDVFCGQAPDEESQPAEQGRLTAVLKAFKK